MRTGRGRDLNPGGPSPPLLLPAQEESIDVTKAPALLIE